MSSQVLRTLITFFCVSMVSCTIPICPLHHLKAKLRHQALASKLALHKKPLLKPTLLHPIKPPIKPLGHAVIPKLLVGARLLPVANFVKNLATLVDPLHLSKIPVSARAKKPTLLGPLKKPAAIGASLRQFNRVKDNSRSFSKERVDGDSSLSDSRSHWVHTLRENIPPADRARHISRSLMSRAFRSFINHDEHTLENLAPVMQPLHHFLSTAGSLILPHPEEDIGHPVEPLLIHSWPNVPPLH
ncbi:uncharacterized protein LOC132205113 [Neocloeon triangulifer]|uniref:uncharacterized protein LOC132205113 n=1 Tax=Neocloeon triangulifer TaxID=2078957 RepID=UPI00286F4616|nr:uncharacterized protein LOC132205113 [Neocloeon triangulifer]